MSSSSPGVREVVAAFFCSSFGCTDSDMYFTPSFEIRSQELIQNSVPPTFSVPR